MKLRELINVLTDFRLNGDSVDFEVGGISCNSKEIPRDGIFVAIKGTRIDGHNFINEAIARGARAIVSEYPETGNQHPGVPFIIAKDTRSALAKLAAEFYNNPSLKIKVVGITGTNGKTTLTYLIESVLKKSGFKTGVIGTVNYRFCDKVLVSKNTTPGPIELESLLAEMVGSGVRYAIMEVSSHALEQGRTEGINFSSAIFTNLTQDHLDYHLNMEDYFKAKQKLFDSLSSAAFSVVNIDDDYGRRLKTHTKAKVTTYGIDNQADVMAENIRYSIEHTDFSIRTANLTIDIRTPLIGRHNVYNILSAYAWALSEGVKSEIIKSAIEEISCIPGRLERINTKKDFSVFVDYAHTEDALKNVITALRQISPGRIIVVFGCGGERDKTKRPKMGRVVTELADYAIVTSDNPRSENPSQIIDDIIMGIKKDNFCVIPDRAEAIRKSLYFAKPGDCVLLAGKGHENYQVLKDKAIHFDDREVVRECLRLMS